MKKIIMSIATISVFLFTSCFTDSNTATVKINLGNIPVAKTAKVEKKSLIDRFLMFFSKEAVAQEVPEWTYVTVIHLGAFDEDDQLLVNKSISVTQVEADAVNTVVKFDVPAGVGRKIVVLGEKVVNRNVLDPDLGEPSLDEVNAIGYYGVSDKTELVAGENKEVEITMEEIKNEEPGDFPSLSLSTYFSSSPATWNLIKGASEYNIYRRDYYAIEKEPISNTKENEFYKVGDKYYSLRIYFEFAKIESADCFFEIC